MTCNERLLFDYPFCISLFGRLNHQKALSFGSNFVSKAATFTKESASKIGEAATHAGSQITTKAQDGSLGKFQIDMFVLNRIKQIKVVKLSDLLWALFRI